MLIPQPHHREPQHEDPQFQGPGAELDSHCGVAPQLFVPPPQFGRLPHTASLREPAPLQVPQPGISSGIAQPELRAGLWARSVIFLTDYGIPVIVLILLLCLGARIGSTTGRLVVAVVGVGLLGCVVLMTGRRRPTRKLMR